MKVKKRTYVGELEWVIEQINSAIGDRNQNRAAQLNSLCKYGIEIAIARRSHEPIPDRPDIAKMV